MAGGHGISALQVWLYSRHLWGRPHMLCTYKDTAVTASGFKPCSPCPLLPLPAASPAPPAWCVAHQHSEVTGTSLHLPHAQQKRGCGQCSCPTLLFHSRVRPLPPLGASPRSPPALLRPVSWCQQVGFGSTALAVWALSGGSGTGAQRRPGEFPPSHQSARGCSGSLPPPAPAAGPHSLKTSSSGGNSPPGKRFEG